MGNWLRANGWRRDHRWTLGFVALLALLVVVGALVPAYDLPRWLLWTVAGAGALLVVGALAFSKWQQLATAVIAIGAVLTLVSGS